MNIIFLKFSINISMCKTNKKIYDSTCCISVCGMGSIGRTLHADTYSSGVFIKSECMLNHHANNPLHRVHNFSLCERTPHTFVRKAFIILYSMCVLFFYNSNFFFGCTHKCYTCGKICFTHV